MYGRQASCKSGVMTSRSNVCGLTLGEQFSKIPVEGLQAAAAENNPQTSTMVNKINEVNIHILQSTWSYTRQCTIYKQCCFSMHNVYGLNSVFLTITPDV